jgi:heat shock protein HtpX
MASSARSGPSIPTNLIERVESTARIPDAQLIAERRLRSVPGCSPKRFVVHVDLWDQSEPPIPGVSSSAVEKGLNDCSLGPPSTRKSLSGRSIRDRTAQRSIEPLSFEINTELSPAFYDQILRFVREYYLLVRSDVFGDVRLGETSGAPALAFSMFGPRGQWRVDATMQAGNPLRVRLTPVGDVPLADMERLQEDLIIEVNRLEEIVRTTTLYFAWVKGQRIVPERPPSRSRRAANGSFSGGFLLLQTLLLGVNIILFILLGIFAVVAVLGVQLAFVLLAGWIFVRMADWQITEENRNVHLVQYHVPREAVDAFRARTGGDLIAAVKREIYDRTFARGLEPTREVAFEVLTRYGVTVDQARLRARVVDVYEIVQEAAAKFNLPVPRVAVTNTMIANAAASGPGPKHGVMVLTTGLLIQLERDEILSVVGHELGHLVGRDPLILFGITSAEFLLRIFVLAPLFLFAPLLYLLVAMGAIYFVAKFFEARADLLSAVRIGQPKVLANALRKIGFLRLRQERIPGYRLMGWTRWDPHPPLYFRIDRLEAMPEPPRVARPLAQSAKDVFRGFAAALMT